MRIFWRWPLNARQDKPMEVGEAVKHALSDPDPEAFQNIQTEMMARLIHVLHKKGVLLPDEVLQVIGKHSYEMREGHAD
jgi:hypothetical protein